MAANDHATVIREALVAPYYDKEKTHAAIDALVEQLGTCQRILTEERRWRTELANAIRRFHKTGNAKDWAEVRRLTGSNPASAPFEPRLPCGHPESAVVQADEGTAYCGDCAAEASDPASERL